MYISNKYVKDLYEKKTQTLMNKIKDYINGEIFHVHDQEDSIFSGVRTFQLDLQIQ